MILLTEIHYLPSIEYFVRLLSYDKLVLEANENYQKQSYRNRCYILGANRVEELSVPVKKGVGKQLITDVQIDYDQKWLPVHWKSITSAYGKAPFFEYYSELFQQIFFKRHNYLFDLNLELLELVLKLLSFDIQVDHSVTYQSKMELNSAEIRDFRGTIHPKSKKSYLKEISSVKYIQLFGGVFVENLSIIDLLFCEGPNASQILKKSHINSSLNI
jgi:hypothetical protein